MIFRRRKKEETPVRSNADEVDYDDAAKNRLRSLTEKGGYSYSEADKGDVEARIRRMWYGAKKEGSKAEAPQDTSSPDP